LYLFIMFSLCISVGDIGEAPPCLPLLPPWPCSVARFASAFPRPGNINPPAPLGSEPGPRPGLG